MSSVSVTHINIYHYKINFVQLNSYKKFDTKISIMKIIHSNKKLITVITRYWKYYTMYNYYYSVMMQYLTVLNTDIP